MIPLKKKQSELRKLNKKLSDLMARQDCDGEIDMTKKLAEACEKEINTLLLLDSIKYIGRYTCFEGGFTSTSKTTILFYQFAMTNRRFLRLQKAVRWQNLYFDLIISKIDENIPIDIRGDRHLGLTVSYIKVKRYISVPSSFNFYDLDEKRRDRYVLDEIDKLCKKGIDPENIDDYVAFERPCSFFAQIPEQHPGYYKTFTPKKNKYGDVIRYAIIGLFPYGVSRYKREPVPPPDMVGADPNESLDMIIEDKDDFACEDFDTKFDFDYIYE